MPYAFCPQEDDLLHRASLNREATWEARSYSLHAHDE